MNLLLLIIACVAAFLGWACLALSQERHWQAVTSISSPPNVSLRRVGSFLIMLSGLLVLARDGLSFGVLFWPLLLGATALFLPAILAWRPSLLRPLASAFSAVRLQQSTASREHAYPRGNCKAEPRNRREWRKFAKQKR